MSAINTCCDQNRGSKFCPDCGKYLRDSHGLESLLAHVESCASRAKTMASRQKLEAAKNPSGWEARQLDQQLKTLLKWEQWRDALKETMQSKGSDQ